MTNRFDVNAFLSSDGWIGYYREVDKGENTVLRDGRRDIIFNSKQEALEAAWQAFLAYLNGENNRSLTDIEPAADSYGAQLTKRYFKSGRELIVERREISFARSKGAQRVNQVERRERA